MFESASHDLLSCVPSGLPTEAPTVLVTVQVNESDARDIQGALVALTAERAMIWVPKSFRLQGTASVQLTAESLGWNVKIAAQAIRIRHGNDGWILEVAFDPPLPHDRLAASQGDRPQSRATQACSRSWAAEVQWPNDGSKAPGTLTNLTSDGFCLRLAGTAKRPNVPDPAARLKTIVAEGLTEIAAEVSWCLAYDKEMVYGCRGADPAQLAQLIEPKRDETRTGVGTARPQLTFSGWVWATLLIASITLAAWRLSAIW